jgi:hypothetical protein
MRQAEAVSIIDKIKALLHSLSGKLIERTDNDNLDIPDLKKRFKEVSEIKNHVEKQLNIREKP